MTMSFYKLPSANLDCRNLAGGEWITSKSSTIPVLSPYNGKTIGSVPMSSQEEVNQLIDKAHLAAPGWRTTPIKERSQILFQLRNLMLRDLDQLANVAAAESGKTVGEARAGVLKGLEVAEFALSLQNSDQGGAMDVSRGVSCEYRREPLGVVAGIVPFNFPAMVPMWMMPIAMTLGNCFVLKPSEKVPLTSQLLGELMLEAGYPPGVFSLINGGKEAVEALIDHPAVKAVGFVGSTNVAKAVYQRTTALGKRSLSLGGAKNHLLVVPDADPELTVRGVVDSFTGCCGQRCMAASLMIAVGDVDHIIDQIIVRAREVKLGDHMGAVIDQASLEKIHGIVGRVESEGGKILLDGRDPAPPIGCEDGTWMGPTIIETTADKEAACEEIFGPTLTIVKVANLSEAMKLENSNRYGNATSVFTTNGAVARYVTDHASNGMIGVNIGVPVPREPFSFGGTKESKFGQGDITGESSLDFWTQLKKITIKWTAQSDNNWMS
jgi:malonate-semialdehyde dehydrogenase (acetylating)/methylmalonate-semialdehyde dehydrogenase